jgi:hypothetical protein
MKSIFLGLPKIALFLSLTACDGNQSSSLESETTSIEPGEDATDIKVVLNQNPLKDAFFGDIHVHSNNSLDAYSLAGVRASTDDAYRFARGEAIEHPLGYRIRLKGEPLDFYAVSDHAEFFGVVKSLADPAGPFRTHPLAALIQSPDKADNRKGFVVLDAELTRGEPIDPPLESEPVIRSAWQENINIANKNYEPGKFTTFIAYEYSSHPQNANLHRVVVFPGDDGPIRPFGSQDSMNPEDLWDWLDALRSDGLDSIAIPHNSNWSQGLMFQRVTMDGGYITAAYAEQRLRNEPMVEITQIKGTSETHPLLSPEDEWSDFELWFKNRGKLDENGRYIRDEDGNVVEFDGATTGAYARDALLTGMELEETVGVNMYQFGFIGSTDGHNAASPFEEDEYFGKLGTNDGLPELRGSVPSDEKLPSIMSDTLDWSASGLAGVWAEKNTRESIFQALKRKETFATSGPRIRVRFFGGYDYQEDLHKAPDAIEKAYAKGVPMGGELLAEGNRVPHFFLSASRDPSGGFLQRAQIVKGWINEGKSHEQIFDVACSDNLVPDKKTHRCPDNDASVNLENCAADMDRGASELSIVWQDPAFVASQRAFYYARVLENPTCRWSTWDAIRAGVSPHPDIPKTIQERAWSTPIWYKPL